MASVPKEVREVFGCDGVPKAIDGGEGKSFVIDNVVFKPIGNVELYEWASETLLLIPQIGFRISLPRKTKQGRYTYAGWGATKYEPGEHVKGKWEEKLRVCRSFHAAVKEISGRRMPHSSDRWTLAHKIAWEEVDLPRGIHPKICSIIGSIFQKYRPVETSKQIIHSDLSGNILFAEGLEPVIIDFSPAHRPKEYAEAILVADAIAWENAPIELISELPDTWYYTQMLIRAVNFRVIVVALFYPLDVTTFEREYENFVALLEHLEDTQQPNRK
ncbi:MAG: hypothetical protein ISS57_03260 [Anaerolineales bacterium]|nr:hypothetical protein [Chloroflexota bacterium]MBL7161599.1 hypothetical protein [Anaerolineales bacterium]